MEEQDLIKGLQVSDRQVQEYLYEKYSRALYGIIRRIIFDQELAEEVFHDAFLKITKKIGSYDESKGRLYTWMANICRNAAIDKTRSKEFSKSSKTNTIDDYVYGMESESGTAAAVDGIGVRELMEDLNEEQRLVMECIYFKGYTHTEVAEAHAIPLGTVKSRVRSALQVLKKKADKI
ncbi:RNA polymerase sigma factor [Cyclobacterium roseum]|uniref:RNA polymerase sigma factor n=1 Tax=Cyclobacterium roseum TaxID=2666137 RepID=UPI00139205FD|nr:sigma-70 family RNA polymerase sigma factor [Cyclobacterium roseum]